MERLNNVISDCGKELQRLIIARSRNYERSYFEIKVQNSQIINGFFVENVLLVFCREKINGVMEIFQ